jgi:hypothetical protein
MANVTVRHIADLAEDLLQDEDNDRWTENDIVNWYNISAREIVSIRPDANPIVESILLASGTKQDIPAGGISMIDAIRNMGADGATPGAAIIKSSITIIQAFDLSWNTATPSATAETWMPISPTQFYVYPPSDGTGYIEIINSKVPATIVYDEAGNWESNLVGVKENFVNALVHDILYYAFSRDTDLPNAENKALKYRNMAMTDLGFKVQGEGV